MISFVFTLFKKGMLQSVPIISFWYNNVLRVVMGKLMTTTGDILDSAVNHAERMSMQSREIQQIGHDLAIENLEKLEEYRSDLKVNYLEGIKNWQECYNNEEDDYTFTPIKESGSGLSIEQPRRDDYDDYE